MRSMSFYVRSKRKRARAKSHGARAEPSEGNRCHCSIDSYGVALSRSQSASGLITHSDRERPNASDDYRQRLDQPGAIASMSRMGVRSVNAETESLFLTIKNNSVTQTKKKCAGGSLNIDNLETAIYFHCGGLDLSPSCSNP